MMCHRWAKTTALLIAHALVVSTLAPAQDVPQQTRPRRVSEAAPLKAPPAEPPAPVQSVAPAPNVEPTLRIGLATGVRSVKISTTGRLLNATDETSAPTPLDFSRVRIVPRVLGPVPLADESEESLAGKDPLALPDGKVRSSSKVGGLQNSPAGKNPNNVRLVSRVSVPTRGLAVYAAGASPLLDARAPVIFSSDDESQHPVKFNEKPYRGRLEVFANERGTLTVVNVVRLEDYVRGVVPNELSPGGYPALEALKAQAVAARTYAISNRGQFAAEGFDLLPTIRSQVYGGRQTEHALTDRAVAETRGIVATFNGEAINALYTSTCGGRTEDAENIFGGEAVPYLRGRECAAEGGDAFAPFTVRTSREPYSLSAAEHAQSAREAALLATHSFKLPAILTDEWLSTPATQEDVRALLTVVARLARRPAPTVSGEATRPPGFSTALARAIDGESRGDVLLDKADVDYLLAFRDAAEIPAPNRADVAILLRDGHLKLYSDATLRPRQAMSRARILHTIARLLESRDLVRLQKATARPSNGGALVLRPTGRGSERTLKVSPDAYLFRAFGDALYQVREVSIVGGEPLTFHTDEVGEVDYMEVLPAPKGAAAERFSPYTNWTVTLTPAEVASRLARSAASLGSVVDLRVVARGSSRRVIDLEVVGTNGTAHVRSGKIRSALGLREQLFVIDRRSDEAGKLTSFVFNGRGWGHGVGMCQVGAYGLARSGWTFERILQAYYTGISLTKMY